MWSTGLSQVALIFLFASAPIVHSFVGKYENHVKRSQDSSRHYMLKWKQMMAESAVTTNAPELTSRRSWIMNGSASLFGTMILGSGIVPNAYADEENEYNNPNMPQEPEEKSGLIVLRVAEVAQFQEKILRAVANGEIEAIVSPQQIVFGTQILLRNSNLDGNMKLMIAEEIPKKNREAAIQNAVKTMNTLQYISSAAARIMRPFKKEEMLEIADMYRDVRINLNQLYEYLPPKEKSKYYGYFVAVTEYEKKIANGTYNPDLDGVLKFD
mmetsp:Transcript_8126/g.11711  ORF Transcript_8126/g.11711 Transcript_8126/m.11711 type:complete len:269 (+) Transcript_8126:47-853(+)